MEVTDINHPGTGSVLIENKDLKKKKILPCYLLGFQYCMCSTHKQSSREEEGFFMDKNSDFQGLGTMYFSDIVSNSCNSPNPVLFCFKWHLKPNLVSVATEILEIFSPRFSENECPFFW